MTSGGNRNPANPETEGWMDRMRRRRFTPTASFTHGRGTNPNGSGQVRAQCNSAALGLARVARAKESGEAACDDGDDEDGPHLEADIDDPAGHRERVLDLRRNGQQLHGGEEGCVTESFDIPAFLAALEYPCKHCAGGVDQNGQAERKYQAREQAPVSFFNLEESGQFFSYHNGVSFRPAPRREGIR